VVWRERADIDWWADHLLRADGSDDAAGRVDRMAYQLGYPDDAVIGAVPVSMWRRVVTRLIERVARAMGIDHTTPVYRRNALATDLGLDPDVAVSMIDALTLDAGNAGWHASVPGVAAPPLVRIDAERVALSRHGLTSEPFFFLTREMRRRDAQEYHNSASLREDVFRQELYRLFSDKRFVHSEGRIVLRRADGKARTDIDAAVFDRKTGALGLFELKSQDPFARSAAELTRQRDNLLYANRQVSGTLDWLNRHGADEVLNRIDRQTAKRFRVRKVHPFVLGRFLAHFNDGQAPDRRAAWATWPQVLRLAGGEPFGSKDSNPIAALFAGIGADLVDTGVPAAMEAMELAIGDAQVRVFPSYAAYRARSV
jgi:hypothetical protein